MPRAVPTRRSPTPKALEARQAKLERALKRSRIEDVRKLLDEGADPNAIPPGAKLPVSSLALRGGLNLPILRLLIERGAQLDVSQPSGAWALPVAASDILSTKFVEELLQHASGPIPEATLTEALYQAINPWSDDEQLFAVAKLLLDAGARVDDPARSLLLLLAREHPTHKACAELFAQHGAPVTLQDITQWYLPFCPWFVELYLARHREVPQDLLNRWLFGAIKSHDASLARLLLDRGAEPEAVEHRTTALCHAALENEPAVARLLLERGAAVNRRFDAEQRTALEVAAWLGHAELVELLAQAGAEVNTVSPDGLTPLQEACFVCGPSMERNKAVPLLLAAGADVHVRDADGLTALHYAVWSSLSGAAQALVQHGADVDAATTRQKDFAGLSTILAGATPRAIAAQKYLSLTPPEKPPKRRRG